MMLYFVFGIGGIIVGSVFTFFMTYPSYRNGYHDGQKSRVKREVLDQVYNEAFNDAVQAMYGALDVIDVERYEYGSDN